MSDRGRLMLIELEGSRSHVYRDVVGFITIGVGHMLTKDELSSGRIVIDDERVPYSAGLSDKQIDVLLQQDLRWSEQIVHASVRSMIKQNQFDALVSFTFNTGAGAFSRSTLLKKVNAGEFTEVPRQFRRWIFAGGRTWDGLVARREKEIEQWNA